MNRDQKIKEFLASLAIEGRNAFQALGESGDQDVANRMQFELDRCLEDLGKILFSAPDEQLDSLFSGIREAFVAAAAQTSAEIAAAVSAERSKIESLKEQIRVVEAERATFNERPDVIEARLKLAELEGKNSLLKAELSRLWEQENLLTELAIKGGLLPQGSSKERKQNHENK